MLEILRNSVNTWAAKILLGLLIASFAVWGISGSIQGTGDTVATVGDADISARDYTRNLRNQLNQYSQQAGRLVTLNEAREAGVDRVVLANLATRAALDEEARQVGLSAGPDAVRNAIREFPGFQSGFGDNFNEEYYRDTVRRQGRRVNEFEADVQRDLAREALVQTVGIGTSAPRELARLIESYRYERRAFSYIVLQPDDAPAPAEPDEATLMAWHTDNPAGFTAPEYRKLSYVWLTNQILRSEVDVDEADIAAAYDTRSEIGEFTAPATRTFEQVLLPENSTNADAARTRLDEGASADDIASAFGATVTRFDAAEREAFPDVIANAVFGLSEPGFAGPVSTPFGTAFFVVSEATEERMAPLEDVRERIQADLAGVEAGQRLIEELTAVDDEIAGGTPLVDIPKATAARFGSIEAVAASGLTPEGTRADLPAFAGFMAEAFGAAEGGDPVLIEADGGGFFAVQVDAITPSALRPYAEVKDDVRTAWESDARLEALEALADGFVARIEAGESIAQIAAKEELDVVDTTPLRRTDLVAFLSNDLIAEVFAADEGAALHGPSRTGRARLFGVLSEIAAADVSDSAIDAASEAYAVDLSNDMVQAYTRSARERHPFLVNEGALNATLEAIGRSY